MASRPPPRLCAPTPCAFDLVQPRQELELQGHHDPVARLLWHPLHADKLASTGLLSETSVRFWDTRSGKNTATLPTPGVNLCMAWSADAQYMVVVGVGAGCRARFEIVVMLALPPWDLISSAPPRRSPWHPFPPALERLRRRAVGAGPAKDEGARQAPVAAKGARGGDGRHQHARVRCRRVWRRGGERRAGKRGVCAGPAQRLNPHCPPRPLQVLSFPELKYEAAMQGHVSRVTCLAQTADRGTLASGSMDAVACVWDMEERICTRTLYDIHHAIRALGYEG